MARYKITHNVLDKKYDRRASRRKKKKEKLELRSGKVGMSYIELKEAYFKKHTDEKSRVKFLVAYFKKYKPVLYQRYVKNRFIRQLQVPELPLFLDFARWVFIDFLRGKEKEFWGIYCYIALPGQGKTISMINHIERMRLRYPDVLIATNIQYKYQHLQLKHWTDIVKFATYCEIHGRKFIIAFDEIHLTFDSSDWKSFPQILQVLLSQNRHLCMQFLCTAQRYDRIPTKVKSLANFVSICENIMEADRMFFNYIYHPKAYEDGFGGDRKKAQYLDTFVADDRLYSLYNTKEMCKSLIEAEVNAEKKRLEEIEYMYARGYYPSEYDDFLPGYDDCFPVYA